MSFKVEIKTLPHYSSDKSSTEKDVYGLPVERTPRNKGEASVTHTQVPASKHYPSVKAVFRNGVRVPVLKDIESKYYRTDAPTSCRFDIVEKVRTVIKPGEYDQYDIGHSDNIKPSGMTEIEQGHFLPRQNTFHSYTTQRQSEQRDKKILAKISPYHWDKYVKSGREGDARDVLYRNTYCLDIERLRYRSSTLPRISQDRPWTVESNESQSTRAPSRGSSSSPSQKETVIIPQQPRGTIVRFREYMKPVTYSADHDVLEVKRYSNKSHKIYPVPSTPSRHVLPLIRQDSRRAKRVERPLKFEHFRYKDKGYKPTLFTKPVHYSSMQQDPFYSADTFKEYLETLQMNATKLPTKQSRESRDTPASYKKSPHHYDFNTHALQSVVDVNNPEKGLPNPPPSTSREEYHRPQDSRSQITIEIKPSWQQNERDTGSDILRISSIRSGELASCEAETDGKSERLSPEKVLKARVEHQEEEKAESVVSKRSNAIKSPNPAEDDSAETINVVDDPSKTTQNLDTESVLSKHSSVIKIPSSVASDNETV